MKLSDELYLHLQIFSIVSAEYVFPIEMWISILWLLIIIFCNIATWTACVYYDGLKFC